MQGRDVCPAAVARVLALAAVFFGLAKDAKGAGNGARADV